MHVMLSKKLARFFQPDYYKQFFYGCIHIFQGECFKTNFKLAIFTIVLFEKNASATV